MSTPYAGVNVAHGAPLRPIAEYYQSRGWQLVPCRWHRSKNGKAGDTPISGVTGGVPFLPASRACPAGLTLHHEGGPETEQGTGAKPAVRPTATVIGIDVDHGYGGKTGGDTLVNAEMQFGPLPGTYSLTARGPWQPSRRIWYRKPADLIIKDGFFTQYGGDIETVRAGHRYSWAWPAVHTKRGQVIGPVLWYDANHNVVDMPHVDQLGELPLAWVEAAYALAAANTAPPPAPVDPSGRTEISVRHAEAIVAKATRRLHELPPSGGEFRNAVFGLACAVARRCTATGHGREDAAQEVRQLFAEHPLALTTDSDDERWMAEGIEQGFTSPWVYVPELLRSDGTLTAEAVAILREVYADDPRTLERLLDGDTGQSGPRASSGATTEEIEAFLASFTRYRNPERLGRRITWMRTGSLLTHAHHLVADAIDGCYPAERAVAALIAACRERGGIDPDAPRQVLSAALGAVLSRKVSA